MTQINSLINFVSGTKALSNEINQNFEAIRNSHNDTDKRASMLEDSRGIDARNYNNGILSALTINEALTVIGNENKTLVLTPGNWTISSNITIPYNVRLAVHHGALLNISQNIVITIKGIIEAPASKIFSGNGNVVFNSDNEIHPEWWGARADNEVNSAAANREAIQKAINSVDKGVVKFSTGTYYLDSTTITLKPNVYLEGKGKKLTEVKLAGINTDAVMFDLAGTSWGEKRNVSLRNMTFIHNWDGITTPSSQGKVFNFVGASDIKFENVGIENSTGNAMYFEASGYIKIDKSGFGNCYGDMLSFGGTQGIGMDSCTSTRITNSSFGTGKNAGIRINDGINFAILACELEGLNIPVKITGSTNRNITIRYNYTEATTGNYDIDAGSAGIIGLVVEDNYLFGVPITNQPINLSTVDDAWRDFYWGNNIGAALKTNLEGLDGNQIPHNKSINGLEWYSTSDDGVKFTLKNTAPTTSNCSIKFDTSELYDGHIKLWGTAARLESKINNGYQVAYQDGGHSMNVYDDTWGLVINARQASANGLKVYNASGIFFQTGANGYGSLTDWNASEAKLKVARGDVNSRSINAAGSINAWGNDYAEYMYKENADDIIQKGEVCGVNSNGRLTKKFSEAHSFVIKSTNPSYVGGDSWATEDKIGKPPEYPAREKFIADGLFDEDGYNNAMTKYNSEMDLFEQKIEQAREKVDRIAFCGQVPCLISGDFKAGDYIIAIQGKNDSIEATAVDKDELTFEQYINVIGKVWINLGDKAIVAVGLD